MISIKALDCALAVFKSKSEEKPTGGMKCVNGDGIIKAKYTDIIEALSLLKKELEEGTMMRVKKCSTCNAFQAPPGAKQGWCFPTNFTNTRSCKGYCSLHERKPHEKE